MAELKRKRGLALSGRLTRMRVTGIVVGVLGIIALVCVYACQQTAGVQKSTAVSEEKGMAAPSEVPPLLNSQCVHCHAQQPETIAARGGKHKTKVGCQDCHREHPPKGTGAIPACSLCHSGKPHYELEQCGSCHSDAHAPLDLKIEGAVTGPCLTCHPQQGDEVQKEPSAHTELACNECHAIHRQIPDCSKECHERHTEDMDFAACVSCHPAHMPLVVTYSQETPSHYCGGCHKEAFDLLAKNTTKHHDLACVFCHKDKHKTVPACEECHPDIHPKAMMKKFPTCGECHDIAHDVKR